MNRPVKAKTGFIGEISLSGEIRPVSHIERRVRELARNGFSRVSVPACQKNDVDAPPGVEIIPASTVGDLVLLMEKNT